MKTLLAPDDARQIVLEHCAPLAPTFQPHGEVLGLTLAQNIVAGTDLPPFDNSSMDGFALISGDTAGASVSTPKTLRTLGTIAAGSPIEHTIEYSIAAGTCAKIMTGAPIPPGADAVVMREETRENDAQVEILQSAQIGQNIRRRGSDVRVGETVIPKGTKIRAAQWAMLASLGMSRVEVFPRPRVGIVTTGNEIVGVGDELKSGQIRDSNSWALRALAAECGAVVVSHQKIGDDAEVLQQTLLAMFQTCDIVVTSGGVSAGDFDYVRDVVPQIADAHFWKVAMKPGKPVLFATRNENSRRIPVFGLPGNPVSVMVAWEQFVRPALLRMQGRTSWKRLELHVRVLDGFRSSAGRTEFARALVAPGEVAPGEVAPGEVAPSEVAPSEVAPSEVAQGENGWTARVSNEQGSGRLSTMTNANALLVVPAETVGVRVGDILTAQMLEM